MSAEALELSGSSGAAGLDEDNPWPGLVPFAETDRKFFQGRGREAEALHRRVRRERLTVLFGKSGLGKTSLLQAGLFPRARADKLLPVYIRLDFSDKQPDLSAQVKKAVAEAAADDGVETPELRGDDSLWECFHRRDAEFWSARNRLIRPLLVFDQFEEIFTLGRDPALAEASRAFLAELEELVEGAPPAELAAKLDEHPEETEGFVFDRHPYKVLIALREDFLPELEELRRRIGALGRNRYRLRPMDGEAAFEVVGQAPHLIDPAVADSVVRSVAAGRDSEIPLSDLQVEPALLSVVCHELNNKRQLDHAEKITEALRAGSQKEILGTFYKRSVADLPAEVRTFVEERLLTVSGYRDSVAKENALNAGVTQEEIDKLVSRRLLRVEERGGVQRLELTHDLLTEVITASRDERRRKEAEEKERRKLWQLRRSRMWAGLFLVLLLLALGAAVSAHLAQKKSIKTLRDQLKSKDPQTVFSAVDRLRRDHKQRLRDVVEGIPDAQFESNEDFSELAWGLRRAGRQPGSRDLAFAVLTELAVRLSAIRKISPPPTWEDDELNEKILIGGGQFLMGSPGEAGTTGKGTEDEYPQHPVELSAFYLQKHEVTNGEYRRFDPTHDKDAAPGLPVVRVTWYDAMTYAAWLGGRLPTEAEWEYAARAGETTVFFFGDDPGGLGDYARTKGNSEDRLWPVGSREPNPWGLHDLYGNVWEWVADWHGPYSEGLQKDPWGPASGHYRGLRGSGYLAKDPMWARSADRVGYIPSYEHVDVGFRVAFFASPRD